MEDNLEEPSDLKSNPLEEGEVDVGACLSMNLDANKSQEGLV